MSSQLQHDGTCLLLVSRDFSLLHIRPERLIHFGQERHRSTRRGHGKTVARFPGQLQTGRKFESRQNWNDNDFDTSQCNMQCRHLVQNRKIKRLQCFSIEGFCSKSPSGGSLEKTSRSGVCLLYVCMMDGWMDGWMDG